jgi:murein DD-endopeptidase MepM/ murein hydrolase activator NlpD
MKIILLRNGGRTRALTVSRRLLALVCGTAFVMVAGGSLWLSSQLHEDAVDAAVVAKWRASLAYQQERVVQLEQKSRSQSAAVGRQLAAMQARLLRMEAIGAHMAESADLSEGEFDFSSPPAQGGPVRGRQNILAWQDLEGELQRLALHLKQRESQLNVLDSVLVGEEIGHASRIRGRPVNWGWISSAYGKRVDPITGKTAWHSGVDFAGRDGSEVIAVASGVVTFAGARSGYGKLVEISHAQGMVTRYAHNQELVVHTGDVVKKGQPIAQMGSTGRSTGPHVHFEVLKHGRTVDPATYVANR